MVSPFKNNNGVDTVAAFFKGQICSGFKFNDFREVFMSNVKQIGVVGAGQMGRGIAQVAAMSGFQVVMFDVNEDGLNHGFEFIKKMLDKGVGKGKWESSFVDSTMGNLSKTTSMADLKDCELVIEAATENKKD